MVQFIILFQNKIIVKSKKCVQLKVGCLKQDFIEMSKLFHFCHPINYKDYLNCNCKKFQAIHLKLQNFSSLENTEVKLNHF